jgi:hypothetical protein
MSLLRAPNFGGVNGFVHQAENTRRQAFNLTKTLL